MPMPSCDYSTLGKISTSIENFRSFRHSKVKEKFEPVETHLVSQEIMMNLIPFTGEGKCSGSLTKYLLPPNTPVSEQASGFVDKDNTINVCKKSDEEGKFFVIPIEKLAMFS